MPDWDEDDELFGDEEESDLGDEEPAKVQPIVEMKSSPYVTRTLPSISGRHEKPKNGARRVKVKPMPAGIKSKWPNVVSMLLTTDSGKQVLFVKG